MVQRFDLIGVHTALNEEARAYANDKLAYLDRYIPEHGRRSAHLAVRLHEERLNGKKQATCEATLHLPRRTISLRERAATLNAAIDLVKARLKQQIQKYKGQFANGKHRRRTVARIKRQIPASLINSADV